MGATVCRFPLYLYYNTILMCRQGTLRQMPQVLSIGQNKIVFQRSQTSGVPQAVLLHGEIRYERILCLRLL